MPQTVLDLRSAGYAEPPIGPFSYPFLPVPALDKIAYYAGGYAWIRSTTNITTF